MKKLFAVLLLAAPVLSCGVLGYENTELRILTNFAAKETCSCMFVMKRTEEYCVEYSRQYIPIGRIDVDVATKTVRAAQGGEWVGVAKWESQAFGCHVMTESTGP